MNKAELIRAAAQKLDGEITKKTAAEAVNTIFEIIAEAVAAGDKVSIAGFGYFEAHQRAARTAKSPVTGESIEVPAMQVPVFRAGKQFKNRVAGKTE
ncbi:MAG: HU family DNA-binding protein [Oscillospiraceae bacterium]|nr:HU family DNA-binding protein [Oscillospiraceae bacterium]